MKTFKKHLDEYLKDKDFKEMYEEEKELLKISIELHEARQKSGKSQRDIAKEANLTQQQVSKIENGVNCNIMTYLKACNAMGLEMKFNRRSTKKRAIKRKHRPFSPRPGRRATIKTGT